MEDPNSRLENDLETLILETFAKTEGSLFSARSLADQLVNEISATTLKRKDPQQFFAPDQYTLSIHPDDIQLLIPDVSHTQTILSKQLQTALEKNGFTLAREPHITVATDPTLDRWEQRVIGWHSSNPLQFMPGDAPVHMVDHRQPPENAFLIVDGKHQFVLDREIFTIGRRLDNHLILEDLHVSRRHARLELNDGHYYIIDCGSTAGTYVNNRQINRHRLHPGDLVRIADSQLIYGEGSGAPDLQPSPHKAAEREKTALDTPAARSAADRLMDRTRPMELDGFHANNQITHPTSIKEADDAKPTDASEPNRAD
ncbi:MAG: DUF3662 domain-containing protein [Anaerolineales bacterium]|nr:DUF3662 domain-containing protein [Anaerolineales bacterium]